MKCRSTTLLAGAIALAPALVPALVHAQATVKRDGQFRYSLGAGASYSSGNTSAASVNIDADGVRATQDSKWRFGGKGLYARSDGVRTAATVGLGTQYDQDITPIYFGFGTLDYLRDEFANLGSRYSGFGGVGRHLIQRETLTWDISVGAGYTHDRYLEPADIKGRTRTSYGRAEALLAEESTHKFTETTTFRQKLSLFPAISGGGGYRAIFDTGIAVAMTPVLNLTAGFTYRYNSDPGTDFKKGDTLFVTGISVKID